MFNLNTKIALTYDDVQLVPVRSSLESRLDADIGINLSEFIKLKMPIITSPMDTVTNGAMARAASNAGAFGIIHRYQDLVTRFKESERAEMGCGVAVGLEDNVYEVCKLLDDNPWVLLVCLDVAHAHHTRVLKQATLLRESMPSHVSLMVGNVATRIGACEVANAGADLIRVGVGNGSICSTRIVTGFGIPSVTSLVEAHNGVIYSQNPACKIVADGGIKSSGDMAKALAAGAHAVMVGSMVAGTDETPGEVINERGTFYKKYNGMASKDAQSGWRTMKKGTAAEGVSALVPYRGNVTDILEELAGGLRSAFSYADARNIQEFYENTEFVQVTFAGVAEAAPHIKNRIW